MERDKGRELKSEQSWSFLWECGRFESYPGIMADLCTSLHAVLYGFVKIHTGGASNTQTFYSWSVFIQGLGQYS